MYVIIIGHRFALASTLPMTNASTQKNSTTSMAKLVINASFVGPPCKGLPAAYLLHEVRTEATKRLPDCVLRNTTRQSQQEKKKPLGGVVAGPP
jgi:hypothetical protein